MWYFTQSPEVFEEQSLRLIQEQMESQRRSYITCLHMRGAKRGLGVGSEMLYKGLKNILNEMNGVWGLVSRPELLVWYRKFGAEVHNCIEDNKNGLAIITFDAANLKRPS